MKMEGPVAVCQQRITTLENQLATHVKKRSRIGWIRFVITVIAASVVWVNLDHTWWTMALPVVIWLVVFLRLVAVAIQNNAVIRHLGLLIQINKEEIMIAQGQYTNRPSGDQFMPGVHDYANDLDIFGRASVYQYINRTTSEQGNLAMAHHLLNPAEVQNILEIHDAVRELAPQLEWRQQLQAHGMLAPITLGTQQKLAEWLAQPFAFIQHKGWTVLRWAFPVITIGSIVLYAMDLLPLAVFNALLLLYLAVSALITRSITGQYKQLNKIVGEVEALSGSLQTIESLQSQSPLLQKMTAAFSAQHYRASAEVKQLKVILDRFDLRLNPLFFIPLNALFLWDLQLIFRLEQWKAKNKNQVVDWFVQLGEMEYLNSMANLHFNQPGWVFPSFVAAHGTFIAEEAGHPLIPQQKRVNSSFTASGMPQLALVTGSNMAGKSTFLRSIGVNIVLAMAGAPVCAASCRLSPMKVISTMRIADNLEESTSTFYAELKKLEYIIQAVNRKEKVFLLFDEILRGTNSADRHAGSEALIRQLMRHQATGILATHDLELTTLQNDYPQWIHNYHFDVQIRNGELYFDYKLKEGICTNMNAAFLMKMIGIEMQ